MEIDPKGRRSGMMTRDEARDWMVQMLLEKIRNDPYPSATQMAIVESVIPRRMVPEYFEILIDKVAQDNIPSLPMLKRIAAIADMLPKTHAS
jgi:hypothetical protein